MTDSLSTPSTSSIVAEVQGLYGTFSFPERLLQKIWARRDFSEAMAQTQDGRTVKVVHPGKWNHLGGPDFSGATLRIGGVEISGDVEIHLHAKDWEAHGHASDPAYDRVVLHVILFPSVDDWTKGGAGRRIPVMSLLPLLHHGLEEYSAEDAMEQLAGRPLHRAQEILGVLGREELNTLLAKHARIRWNQKVHFARERIKRLGWESACHHAALEALGYRFNRATMLSIATEFPLKAWVGGVVEPLALFEQFCDRWSLQGVRPNNHPRKRLVQYFAWVAQCGDWPMKLREWSALLGLSQSVVAGNTTGDWRRVNRLAAVREGLAEDICGGALGGSRLDNLICDSFLPLCAAETGESLETIWAKWFVGDAPDAVVDVLKALAVFDGHGHPVAQGPVQGLLGWMIERESQTAGCEERSFGGRGT